MSRILTALLFLGLLAPGARAGESAWRSMVTLPPDPTMVEALDAFAIAEQLGDSTAVQAALERGDWTAHVREWCAARWAARRGHTEAAFALYAHAARMWPADEEEPGLVLALFDEERLQLALDTGDLATARAILRQPLRPHHGAIWRALRGRLELAAGKAGDAVDRLERAWEQADAVDRRHPVFLHRAPAQLAIGEAQEAAEAWHASISLLRRPERLRAASAVWDSLPGLREAVTLAEEPDASLRFLVRVLRRAEAMEVVRTRLEQGVGDRVQQELFVAEQLYRLREHERLRSWLDGLDRTDWDEEQLAKAEGYLWGVERREGVSVAVGEGFDELARTWPDTPRAAEAWWESAWMYELSDLPDSAASRYARHVESTTRGRFRSSAALRTVLLPFRAGDHGTARENEEKFRAALGSGMDQAAAWHLLELAGGDGGEEAARRLRREHPASPFWRSVTPATLEAPGVRDLHRVQTEAFALIFEELGGEWPLQDLPEGLTAIARVAELGLRTEATVRLDAFARLDRGDDLARARAVAIAFSFGLPELQGRHGWFLERRLKGRDDALDAALRAVALPTPFAGSVRRIARELDLPAGLLWALMRRESFFDADVVSLAGAYGLMQLLPTTAGRVALRLGLAEPSASDLFVPETNLRLGAAYLAGLREESAGNWVRALASYNAGEGNGQRWEARLQPGEPPELGILLISYTETRSYVYNVLRVAHLYSDVWNRSP